MAHVKVVLMISVDKDKKKPKVRSLNRLLPYFSRDYKGAPGFVH